MNNNLGAYAMCATTISDLGKPRHRAVKQLQQWLADSREFPDGLLPSEQELSRRLGISQPTTHRALTSLADKKLLRCEGRQWKMVSSAASIANKQLLDHAVLIISPFTGTRPAGQISPGWEISIQISTLQALETAGHQVLSIPPGNLETSELQRLLGFKPMGVIAHRYSLVSDERRSILDQIRNAGIPLAIYGDAWDLPDFDTVGFDHAAATRELVLRLAAAGRKRILRVWQGDWPGEKIIGLWFKERDEGYAAACEKTKLRKLPGILLKGGLPQIESEKDFDQNASIAAGQLAKSLLGRNRADAILCASDGMVPRIIRACKILGLKPGVDVLITGYDNYWTDIPELRWEDQPPYLTVDKQNEKIGIGLVRLLMDRVGGRLPAEPQHRLVSPVIRTQDEMKRQKFSAGRI